MPRKYKDMSATEIAAVLDEIAAGLKRREVALKFDIATSTVGTIEKNFSGKPLSEIEAIVGEWNAYRRIWNTLFAEKFDQAGKRLVELPFTSKDIARTKERLKIVGGNPYDPKYNIKGRGALPDQVQAAAPKGKEWRIKSTAKGKYVFALFDEGAGYFDLDDTAELIKIPNALPAIVERYARDDEQSLLAKIRYNNLVAVFLGIAAYSLQSHWKTSLRSAPVEVDEIYVGVDTDGMHYAVPVEAKGREKSEAITEEQILNNYRVAKKNFPHINVIPIAAKVIDDYSIAMISFQVEGDGDEDDETFRVTKALERHYTVSDNPTKAGASRPVLSDKEIEKMTVESSE